MLGPLLGVLLLGRVCPNIAVSLKYPVEAARVALGLAVGAAVTSALFAAASAYALSLLALVPAMLVIVYAGYVYFRRGLKLDPATAYFCALPGGIIEVMTIGEALGGNAAKIFIIHICRILLVIVCVPFVVQHGFGFNMPSGFFAAPDSARPAGSEIALLLLSAALGWGVFNSLRLPGASLVGPMLASGLVYAMGWVETALPVSVVNFALVVLGANIGMLFVGIPLRELYRGMLATLGYLLILTGGVVVAVTLVSHFADIPLIAVFLAFMPGGQAEMNAIALTVGVMVPYIAAHHVLRLLLVVTAGPILFRALTRRTSAGKGG